MEMIMRSYPNDWVSNSMMYRHGVAKVPTGKVHTLSAEVQGVYNYTIGPAALYLKWNPEIRSLQRRRMPSKEKFDRNLTSLQNY